MREDLVGRLIEYQNYKEYTQLLTEKKKSESTILLNTQLTYPILRKRHMG